MNSENESENDSGGTLSKPLVVFGRDISKIPCFRNSFLYGIGGGISTGLASFMFTSRTRFSCNMGMLSFTLVTLGYWSQCRYNYSVTKFEMLKMQEGIRLNALYEGTDKDDNFKDA